MLIFKMANTIQEQVSRKTNEEIIKERVGEVLKTDHELLPDLASPRYAFHVANELKKFVTEQKLTVDIQKRQYALVEAWQFTGAQFGLYPILTDIKNESTYNPITFTWVDSYKNQKTKDTFHYKYRATVEIRKLADDKVLSKAEIVCTNEEYGKHEFAEYAIMSMAQTRAEGKAWRMLLGWVMKAAGFEATPFEEMDEEKKDFFDNCPSPEEKQSLTKLVYSAKIGEQQKEELLATIHGCTTYELFNYLEARLKNVQPSIHETQNPSQTQINEHLKKLK